MAEDTSGKAAKKPLYKRVWFWVLAIIVIAASLAALVEVLRQQVLNASSSQTTSSAVSTIHRFEYRKLNCFARAIGDDCRAKAAESSVPTEYKSALKKAELIQPDAYVEAGCVRIS